MSATSATGPNGRDDYFQIVLLSEVVTKDGFFNIKKAMRDDLLSAHRVPPQVFVINELTTLQERMKEVSSWFVKDVINFRDYKSSF
ncbi:hypothetical protein [Yersinia intermedia]|uniref:hypothetical protein n=1 Tax=Yersinia intermedia TaxID=631 RepID=UPI0006804221